MYKIRSLFLHLNRSARSAWILACLLIFISLISGNIAQADASDNVISFELPRAPMTPLQKIKQSPHQNLPQGVFEARLRMPSSTGKYPAMVLVHTCHDAKFYQSWLDRLQEWGFATLSFSRCQPPTFIPDDSEIPSLDWKRGSIAALGAMNFLNTHPQIRANEIGVLSWSRLGMISLSTLQYEGFAQFFDQRFAFGIALYPFCSFARGPHSGPILVIGGAQDTWIDNKVCQRISAQTLNDEFPVETILLEDAVHGFDIKEFGTPKTVSSNVINPDRFAAGGGVLGYHEPSANKAIDLVHDFLKKNVSSIRK